MYLEEKTPKTYLSSLLRDNIVTIIFNGTGKTQIPLQVSNYMEQGRCHHRQILAVNSTSRQAKQQSSQYS